MADTDDHPEHSSGTSAFVSSNPSVSISSKPISSWTAEDVVEFLQLFGVSESGARTSQTPNAVTGRQICAWNNTQLEDFLRAADIADSAIVSAALAFKDRIPDLRACSRSRILLKLETVQYQVEPTL